jgi:hypothetical protein
MSGSINDDALRNKLGQMMSVGLKTDWETRAYTSEQVNETVARLQDLKADDYEQKLVIAGFTLEPYGDEELSQSCETCMYYLLHRKYSELPQLDVPVEPQWSCILWRV